MNKNDLVSKLWKLCDDLRDGGVSYQNYVNELATLLFLKMCEETGLEEDLLPDGFRWKNLLEKKGQDQHQFYRNMLVQLGDDDHSVVRAIFQNVNTSITQAKNLTKLVSAMDALDWYNEDETAARDDFGDMYEGLLQKNANETKSGAGQYFTPRALIKSMVRLMQPEAREIVQDPAAGTAGFLIEADRYIKNNTNDLEDLDDDDQEFQRTKAFVGVELVPGTRRLALMNCLLHDIEGEGEGIIKLGNSLGATGESLPAADLILTNPPFGSASGSNITRKFVHQTNNKQLCFMQHIYNNLEPGGRAAVVVPDNVLFEGGMGTSIRKDMMDKCNVHTILRLPTGIFYAAGVKTNVLFFQKGTPDNPNQDIGCTKETWVFDLRTNMNSFGKRTPFTEHHLKPFEEMYSADKNGHSPRSEGVYHVPGSTHEPNEEEQVTANARWRKFDREYISKVKGDSLDISWLKDRSITDAATLGKPEILAEKAMTEMVEALQEINNLMLALGAKEASDKLINTLASEFDLAPREELEAVSADNAGDHE
ncbi:N-6 DNA methylase [Endozoicomonas ascidiicola]|uniref:N-6 DNA methylase n=1 Tax=Endozoicomonas ascidiicola TaxID=1698521 RepID=UPI0008375639|nr:N-6 DNA methylase [Endozoicomonas ascidiicola]